MWDDILFSEEDIIYLMGYEDDIRHRKVDNLKLSSEDISKYQEELIKRYCFLYENSFYILGCLMNFYSLSGHILYGMDDPFLSLKKEISKKIGISNHFYYFGETHDFIYLIEDVFFGEGPLEDMELYKIINAIKDRDTFFPDLKKRFFSCEDASFNDVDATFRILLESVKAFVSSQNDISTYTYKNGGKLTKIWKYLPDEKKDLLNVYYGIHDYGLKKMDVYDKTLDFQIGAKLDKSVERTYVGWNRFLCAFSNDYTRYDSSKEMVSISDDMKKELYYKYHKVLDWNLVANCEGDDTVIRPLVTNPCGKSFRIREGEVFFYENNFYHLCPDCRYIVKIDSSLLPDHVVFRIKNRCVGDKRIFKKFSLLSELQCLEKEGKVLSKK